MVLISCFLCFVSNLMAAGGPSSVSPVTQESQGASSLTDLNPDPLSIIMSHLGPTDLRSFAQVNRYTRETAVPERDKRYSLEIIDDTVIIYKHSHDKPPEMVLQFLLSHLSDGNHDTPQHDNFKLLAKLIDQSPKSLVISEVKILGKEFYPLELGPVLETIETDLLPVLKRKFPAIEIDSQLHLMSGISNYGNHLPLPQIAANYFLEKPRETKLVLTSFPQDKIDRDLDPAAKAAIQRKAILTSQNSPSLDLGFLREISQLTAEQLATRLNDPREQERLRRSLGVGFSDVLWNNSTELVWSALDLAHVPGGHDLKKLQLLLNYQPTGFFKHATLRRAILDGNEPVVKQLLRAGAPLEFELFYDSHINSSALSLAVHKNNLPLVKLLLASGASIKTRQKFNPVVDPIHRAVLKTESPSDQATRNLILIELLKQGDFDFQSQLYHMGEKTLAEIAAHYGNPEVIQIIQNALQAQQAAHVGQSFPVCRPGSSLHVTPFSKIFDMLGVGAQPVVQ
jgi:hypothetical protein